jgi:hypothetical protein
MAGGTFPKANATKERLKRKHSPDTKYERCVILLETSEITCRYNGKQRKLKKQNIMEKMV